MNSAGGGHGRRLVLLRHAKAEIAGGVPDELRPLALPGRRQCTAVGAGLVAADVVPEHALVSSAVRTRQTWELVRSAMGDVPEADVTLTDRVYEARAADVVDLLRATDERLRTVLVVGHEPAMSGAAALLAAGTGDPALLAQVRTGLPTATYAVLEVPVWSALGSGSADLVDVVAPAR